MPNFESDVERLVPRANNNALLVGLFLGAIVGAAAAALLNPRRGAANREDLRERGLELKDRADTLLRARQSPL